MALFKLKPRVPRTFKSLSVNDGVENGKWANHDVLPVPVDKLTLGWKAFFGYWWVLPLPDIGLIQMELAPSTHPCN